MPGFGPAAEVLFFREKDPKPLTPRPASLNETDARFGRADQLAALRQGPPVYEGVLTEGRAAGVGIGRGKYERLWKFHVAWHPMLGLSLSREFC